MRFQKIFFHLTFFLVFKHSGYKYSFVVFKKSFINVFHLLVFRFFSTKWLDTVWPLVRYMSKFCISFLYHIHLLRFSLLYIAYTTHPFDGNWLLHTFLLGIMNEMLHIIFALEMTLLHHCRSIRVNCWIIFGKVYETDVLCAFSPDSFVIQVSTFVYELVFSFAWWFMFINFAST